MIGNRHKPDQCRVTVYTCCPMKRLKAESDRMPDNAHQCHEPPVKDGLCLRHLGDRIRLRQSLSR